MPPYPQLAWEHRNRFMTVRALTPNGLGIPEAALMPNHPCFSRLSQTAAETVKRTFRSGFLNAATPKNQDYENS
jgi:hypothetical protein